MKFSWLPGTLTQVIVRHQDSRKVLHIDRVHMLFGRPALDGLYLLGRYSHDDSRGAPFDAL